MTGVIGWCPEKPGNHVGIVAMGTKALLA